MHGFHGSLEKRIKALERRLGNVPTIETDAEISRRTELVKAAHLDLEPANLTATEMVTFERIKATVSIARELLEDGTVDADGEPGGDDPHRDLDDDAPVWEP